VQTDVEARSFTDVITAPGGDTRTDATPWGTSFLVNGNENEPITMEQVTAKDFKLVGTIDYIGESGIDRERFPLIDEDMMTTARHLDGATFGPSDLASVPRFLRWFENTYGRHTPAALIHDNLIEKTPNGGTLHNDVATDRFFRFMLAAAGVPLFKRWIMWAAVAYRTRLAVGGGRRLSVFLWVILASLGIAAFVVAIVAIASGTDGPGGISAWALLGGSLVAPVVASALWGKQWGAGLVTAAAAPFVLPPAAIAAVGYSGYWVLERLARRANLH
jgi:hypothetical protein